MKVKLGMMDRDCKRMNVYYALKGMPTVLYIELKSLQGMLNV